MSADDGVVSASEVRRLEERVGELERLLGRKIMEAEIPDEALSGRRQKTDLADCLANQGRYSATRTWIEAQNAKIFSDPVAQYRGQVRIVNGLC